MISKSFIAYAFLLCFTTSVNAHALINSALGVKGKPTRDDVQRPSTGSPCGNVNIAQTIDTTTPIPVSANGSFSTSIVDFNPGSDGSRSIKTVQVDSSGTGKDFVPAKMVANGDANPKEAGTDQLTVQLPRDTKCTGGKDKNRCLVSFTTTAGFGNCVVLSQGANDQAAPSSPSPSPSPASKKSAKKTSDKSDNDTSPANPNTKDTNETCTTTDNNSRRAAGAEIRRRASFKRNWDSR